MTWVKLDDAFADHPKVDRLGDAAFRLHVSALCYSARLLTDGRIPARAIRRLTPTAELDLVDELIDAGLWHADGDGYVVNDFLEYNQAAADVKARRKADAERKRRQRAAGAETASRSADGTFRPPVRPDVRPDVRAESGAESTATRPVPSRPQDSSSETSSSSNVALADPKVEEEETSTNRTDEVLVAAVELLAERTLEHRSPDAPPILNRTRWIRATAADRLEQHRPRALALLDTRPELEPVELAAELEPDLAPRIPPPAPCPPSCPTCNGEQWVAAAGGNALARCPRSSSS